MHLKVYREPFSRNPSSLWHHLPQQVRIWRWRKTQRVVWSFQPSLELKRCRVSYYPILWPLVKTGLLVSLKKQSQFVCEDEHFIISTVLDPCYKVKWVATSEKAKKHLCWWDRMNVRLLQRRLTVTNVFGVFRLKRKAQLHKTSKTTAWICTVSWKKKHKLVQMNWTPTSRCLSHLHPTTRSRNSCIIIKNSLV